MQENNDLIRFLKAQENVYPVALSEVIKGRKRSHWMWFIFPQIKGLGVSETSRYYAIQNKAEAEKYLKNPILGERLIQISNSLLSLKTNNATDIFGSPDDIKLKSCMTLFDSLPNSVPVFKSVLEKFFHSEKDEKTLQIIGKH